MPTKPSLANTKQAALQALSEMQGTPRQHALVRAYLEGLEDLLKRQSLLVKEVQTILPSEQDDDCG